MLLLKGIDIVVFLLISVAWYMFFRKTEIYRIAMVLYTVFFFLICLRWIGLDSSFFLVENMILFVMMCFVIVFQAEIRIHVKKYFKNHKYQQVKKKNDTSIEQIGLAAFSMSKKKIGALIILDYNQKASHQSENLTPIQAKCTKELIETIFYPSTILHDGAILIQNGKIAFAGCKLPLHGKKREEKEYQFLGTRHLVALETAENLDLIAVVVSEETGNVSIATKNGLKVVQNMESFKSFFL